MSNVFTPTTGREFDDPDVVAAYVHRADYPAALYDRLLALGTGRTHLVDLGCGPGKLARRLAPHFATVEAIDPSAGMLALGRRLDGGANPNIRWTKATAEAASLGTGVDLVVAGASLHWMDPAIVMPKLAGALTASGRMAIIDGDAPVAAPWIEAWRAVIVDWVGRLGDVWNGGAHRARATAHEAWFDLEARERFEEVTGRAVEDLIAGEHSRATWARARMAGMADAFDADLRRVLEPFAVDGRVTFVVQSTLAWGRPRAGAR